MGMLIYHNIWIYQDITPPPGVVNIPTTKVQSLMTQNTSQHNYLAVMHKYIMTVGTIFEHAAIMINQRLALYCTNW